MQDDVPAMRPAANGAAVILPQDVDLSNCDREQIQYAGAILPHGVLLTARETDLIVLQASANCGELLGIEAEELLGKPLSLILSEPEVRLVREHLSKALLNLPQRVLHTLVQDVDFDVLVHRADHVLIFEFEKHPAHDSDPVEIYSAIRETLVSLEATRNVQAFFDLAVDRIRAFTGFDRVLAYKFMHDGSGWVRSESMVHRAGLSPYRGQRFPAVDIPQPARRLFALTWLRHQPDIGYVPVPLTPLLNPATGGPLDMSCALLRSVSVMYTGYLKNMGTHASMVMTLLKEGKLWGLIACHHHSGPLHVPYEARVACEFMAHMVSFMMSAKEDLEESEYRASLKTAAGKMLSGFAAEFRRQSTTPEMPIDLSGFVRAGGTARVGDGKVQTQGSTPNKAEILALARWLSENCEGDVFATDCLSAKLPQAEGYVQTASGLLAIRLSKVHDDYLLWFRPEQIQTVEWAGDPRKPVDISADGQRLMPRTSFAIWKETVHRTAEPWLEPEVAAATDLRNGLVELVIREADRLRTLYADLERSHNELDTFAYVASHDLKEPLRGISNYAKMLNKDYEQQLDKEGRERLETLVRLSRRMDDLLNSLLEYSRIGRGEVPKLEVDMNEVAREAMEALATRIEKEKVNLRILFPLPPVIGDKTRLGEVLLNLFSNAIKYNDKAAKVVEFGIEGMDASHRRIFYVRDNGIGVQPEHREQIFEIFRRLHGRDEFGGGSGAGLTIVKKIVELHGGTIWVESAMNEGSTFYFALPSAEH